MNDEAKKKTSLSGQYSLSKRQNIKFGEAWIQIQGHLCHSTWGPQTESLTKSITEASGKLEIAYFLLNLS